MKINKIAIYHGLKKGGALFLLHKVRNCLIKKGYKVDIFTTNQEIKYINNFIGELATCLFWLKNQEKIVANKINSEYDSVLVFPSMRVQIPSILRYLKINSCYMFLESKREFFEETSFDHFSIRRSMLRLLRYPICILDYYNSKFINKCISISYYSKYVCEKIYKVKSTTISPIQKTKTKSKRIDMSKTATTIGHFSKIKGHDFSLFQIHKILKSITLIGNIEPNEIINFINKYSLKTKFKLIKSPKSIFKTLNKLPKHSLYLANNKYEPYGLSTLDATSKRLFVLGKNTGGTPEIISTGINGYLYPDNLELSRKVLAFFLKQKTITYYNNSRYDWNSYTDKLIYEITNPFPPPPHPQQP